MSKRTKRMLFACIGLVVLVGLFFAVRAFLPEKEQAEESSASNYITLLKTEYNNVKKVAVTYPGAGYVLHHNNGEYSIEGLEGLPISSDQGLEAVGQAAGINARSMVEENAKDLALYGLDNPKFTVDITLADGSGLSLEFGLESSASYGVYAKEKGKNDIYLFYNSDISAFKYSANSFVSKSIMPSVTETMDFKSITFSGKNYPEPLVMEKYNFDELGPETYAYFTYAITAPKLRPVDAETLLTHLDTISATTAKEVLVGNYTPETLAEYGLDDPDTYIEVVYTEQYEADKVFTFSLSFKDDTVYAICNDTKIIYTLDKKDWMGLKYETMVHSLFVLPFINTVSQVQVETAGKTYTFDISGENSDTITYNGQSIERDLFTKYYQLLISASNDGNFVTDITPTDDPVLRITYAYRSGGQADVVEFYTASTRRMYVAVNGEIEFTMLSSYLEKVQQGCEAVIKGEAVDPDWRL